MKITIDYLKQKGFAFCDGHAFEGMDLPYYAKDGALLFFNRGRFAWESSDYRIGFGEMRQGVNHVACFRWINNINQIELIYRACTGKEL